MGIRNKHCHCSSFRRTRDKRCAERVGYDRQGRRSELSSAFGMVWSCAAFELPSKSLGSCFRRNDGYNGNDGSNGNDGIKVPV